MALHFSRDSAIVQLVFAFEKASVAAVKRETSMVLVEVGDLRGLTESLVSPSYDGIALGSWVDVMGAGSSSPLRRGEGGGVGGVFGH